MGWKILIVGYHALKSVAKPYVKVFNTIFSFVEPTTPTNTITNNTILAYYSIKQGLSVFGKKLRLKYKKSCISSINPELLSQRSLKTSAMNN